MECYFPIDKIEKGDSVAIWGYGEIGEKLIRWNERFKYCNIVCVFEKNQKKEIPFGIKKSKIDRCREYNFDKLIVTITRDLPAIKRLILKLNIPIDCCVFLAEENYIEYGKISYSQNGEDILIYNLLKMIGKDEITFCDIGANDPFRLNNTYFLEKSLKVKKGVLVEPNPILARKISRERKNVICLHCGVSDKAQKEKIKFYVMDVDTLSSFSKEKIHEYEKLGYKLKREEDVDCININQILDNYFMEGVDVLSIDTEGLDLKIIESINYNKHRPTIVCVETSGFYKGKDKDGLNIINNLVQKGYIVFADTFINTIFIDKKIIEREFDKDIKTIYPLKNHIYS